MFCYQKNFSNPTLPVDEAQFWALVRATQWNENIDKYRETHDAALKRKLPAFIFQATFDETLSKAGKLGRWRKQAATRLTGLVVMDVDHVENPQEVHGEWLKVHDFESLGILLIYVTPSGQGLKIVFKARTDWGNLIDNQHEMAKVLGVEVDESCKDASRMSFICKESDILFIDKELFTYENKEFAERYDALYRDGRSQGKRKMADVRSQKEEVKEEVNEETGNYHGVEYKRICEAWQAAQGAGCLDCADLCRTSSESEGTKKSQTLLIRLVSESCTKTFPRGCKGYLKVWVFMAATPLQLQSLWEQLKCLTNSSLKGWNLSFAPLMPKPVGE